MEGGLQWIFGSDAVVFWTGVGGVFNVGKGTRDDTGWSVLTGLADIVRHFSFR